VDPSLCSKQRQLKRAKLADSLANQLSHRPGPLELIQKNILHTDDPVEQLVKQGSIPFTPTAEGVVVCKSGGAADGFDDDSSDTAPSPLAVSGRGWSKSSAVSMNSAEHFSGNGVPDPTFLGKKSRIWIRIRNPVIRICGSG
jgi:hypothetical protein